MTRRRSPKTVLDYFEGWFDGNVARMDRALHPELAKRRAGEEIGRVTKERMLELTGQGHGATDRADGRVEVTVHDVYATSRPRASTAPPTTSTCIWCGRPAAGRSPTRSGNTHNQNGFRGSTTVGA